MTIATDLTTCLSMKGSSVPNPASIPFPTFSHDQVSVTVWDEADAAGKRSGVVLGQDEDYCIIGGLDGEQGQIKWLNGLTFTAAQDVVIELKPNATSATPWSDGMPNFSDTLQDTFDQIAIDLQALVGVLGRTLQLPNFSKDGPTQIPSPTDKDCGKVLSLRCVADDDCLGTQKYEYCWTHPNTTPVDLGKTVVISAANEGNFLQVVLDAEGNPCLVPVANPLPAIYAAIDDIKECLVPKGGDDGQVLTWDGASYGWADTLDTVETSGLIKGDGTPGDPITEQFCEAPQTSQAQRRDIDRRRLVCIGDNVRKEPTRIILASGLASPADFVAGSNGNRGQGQPNVPYFEFNGKLYIDTGIACNDRGYNGDTGGDVRRYIAVVEDSSTVSGPPTTDWWWYHTADVVCLTHFWGPQTLHICVETVGTYGGISEPQWTFDWELYELVI